MQIFKFGGASIRHGKAIRNMVDIIRNYGEKPLVVVVSAMGKTTRALESFIEALVNGEDPSTQITEIKQYHLDILHDLFPENDPVFNTIEQVLAELAKTPRHEEPYGKFYARIVAVGEMMSAIIITAYLNRQNITATKVDAPNLIKSAGNFQNGEVDWQHTESLINSQVTSLLAESIVVTQGFISSNHNGEIMTLGKEGSDYTAAIFATCLDADQVTIWKDVPGILSADPKLFDEPKQLMHLPYTEASEMTYYGASVIHPKTIKPLANKDIPLFVRSFDDPGQTPTKILGTEQADLEPTVILKKNQCLFTFRVRDYTFVDEENLARIFSTMHQLDISLNMLQSSAITISICFDYQQAHIDALFSRLQDHFSLHYMTNLELITLKNYNDDFLQRYRPKVEIIMEQRSRRNCRFLVREQ
jgi:aspartate kinase